MCSTLYLTEIKHIIWDFYESNCFTSLAWTDTCRQSRSDLVVLMLLVSGLFFSSSQTHFTARSCVSRYLMSQYIKMSGYNTSMNGHKVGLQNAKQMWSDVNICNHYMNEWEILNSTRKCSWLLQRHHWDAHWLVYVFMLEIHTQTLKHKHIHMRSVQLC